MSLMVEAGGIEPLFDVVRLRVSADVLPERICGRSEMHGSFWMAPDVITFVIVSPVIESRRKKLTGRRRLADEYEKASRTNCGTGICRRRSGALAKGIRSRRRGWQSGTLESRRTLTVFYGFRQSGRGWKSMARS
jgi:hypothetical protein